MKLSYLLCLSYLVGCASAPAPPPSTPPQEMPPIVASSLPTEAQVQEDTEAREKDRAMRKEQANWKASVFRIQTILDKHQIDYKICIAVSGNTSKSCAHMLEQFCERSIYIDTRGGHMEDPLCENSK